MDLQLRWHAPIDLYRAADLIYDMLDLTIEELPPEPGVYVFARSHGGKTVPLYIGRAENIQRRIKQQFNNLKLMRGIERSPTGARKLFLGQIVTRPNQRATDAIKIIESALISTAMVEGYDLLNVSGTRTLAHSITSSGNREARLWLPDNVIKLRRA